MIADALRLVGATAEALLEEVKQNAENWDYLNYAPALKDRPVLILEVDDRNTPDNQALAAALKKVGNSRATETITLFLITALRNKEWSSNGYRV